MKLLGTLQKSLRRHDAIDKFRFLLYGSGLTPEDLARIKKDDMGVKWLVNEKKKKADATVL